MIDFKDMKLSPQLQKQIDDLSNGACPKCKRESKFKHIPNINEHGYCPYLDCDWRLESKPLGG